MMTSRSNRFAWVACAVLLAAGLPSAVGGRATDPGTVPDLLPVAGQGPSAYAIAQLTVPPLVSLVEPLSAAQSVQAFYRYSPCGPSNPLGDIRRIDVSTIFFYQGPDGISMVLHHDSPNGATGGTAKVTFKGLPAVPSLEPTGLPAEGTWVVRDDEFPCGPDRYSNTDVSWTWLPRSTDGGAFRGGLDGLVYVEIDAEFTGIDEWHFLSGDPAAPERIVLDPAETLFIAAVR